jgi:putative ABC transport system permease protein
MGAGGATVSVGLVQILADYMAQLSRVRTSLFLLMAQAFFFVLYTLGLLATLMLDRSHSELVTLSGRGASTWQITRIFALESLLLALPAALLLGPGLAYGGMRLWAEVSGQAAAATLPRESWLLSGVATGLGWLALVVPVSLAARGNPLEWRQTRARPARRSKAQRLYLDLFLLIFGGLLYWQLNQSGSFVVQRMGDIQIADPLLLLAPSLLLIATALIFLRLFPFLLQSVAWVFQRLRGLMLPLGLRRLARDPLKPSRVVLLISLTAGLILFSSVFGGSLSFSQEEMALYLAGADLRVSLAPSDQPGDQPTPGASQLLDQLATLPGVRTVSPTFRGTVQTEEGRLIQLLAVDPVTFAQVARLPVNVTNLKIATLMQVIGAGAGDEGLPAVFAFSALPSKTEVGDQSFVNLAGRRLPLSVRGTISNFPTLSGSYVILSLTDLEAQVDLDTPGIRRFGSREAWLAVDPVQHGKLVQHPALEGRVLDDAWARLNVIQSDALAQGTNGAFRLNTLTLALLSVAAFWLVQFFAAQQRVVEFSVLRAMGLAVRQLLALLLTEGVLVLALGLMAGTVIGYGLARVMIPYLSQALTGSLGGVTIKHIVVDWPAIVQLYGLLIVFYGLALALLLVVLMRVGIHQTLRMGEE